MKKPKFKKIISALLSATIVCSTFTALPFSVSATENETAAATNDEAVSVKKAPEPVGAKVPSEQVGAASGNFEYSVKNNSVTITK
ncbi:MAG: hypothetical protein MJ089_08345, partial [Ruminococcus sp.]|nr:hypothetical protein [Ruminococcus sp.]